ncbi:MAG: hypothetical protein U1E56_10200 [Bauldia sp.]
MPRAAALLAVASAAFLAACGKPAEIVEKSYFAGNDYWVVIVNRSALKNPAELTPIARRLCQEKEACLVGMWFDAKKAPNFLPVNAEQRREQIYIYGWREATKAEIANWNCEVFPNRPANDCMTVSLNR